MDDGYTTLGDAVPSAAELLSMWEQHGERHTIDAALGCLALAAPIDPDELANLPLGTRDAALIRLRRAALGDLIIAIGTCPACGLEVEAPVSCSELLGQAGGPPAPWTLEAAGIRLELRALNSRDAAAAASLPATAGAAELLGRAVVAAEGGGAPIAARSLEPGVVAAVAASLAGRDPLAEVTLELACPSCDHRWEELLDVAPFVVEELAAEGRRILAEVDVLARAYGWREHDILAMSDGRRRAYGALAAG
ncbi:MAG TPA: hypothetical protein VNH13_06405 [Candidatus Acidoferrales bacterium]|nr:hypothetical protein [Candidatus Acidoferrales bacterium]